MYSLAFFPSFKETRSPGSLRGHSMAWPVVAPWALAHKGGAEAPARTHGRQLISAFTFTPELGQAAGSLTRISDIAYRWISWHLGTCSGSRKASGYGCPVVTATSLPLARKYLELWISGVCGV